MPKELTKKELKAIEDGKDKTSVDKNSKAPAINHPKSEISPISMKEKYKIKIPLDQNMRMEKAERMCVLLEEIEKLETDKGKAAKAFAEQITAKETELSLLKDAVGKKYEEKEVICEIERDFGNQVRRYMYKGICYGEEPLKKSDHQYDLDHAERQIKNPKMEVVKSPLPAGFIQKLKKGDWIETAKGSIVELTEDDLLTLKADQVKGYASDKQISDAIAAKKKPKK